MRFMRARGHTAKVPSGSRRVRQRLGRNCQRGPAPDHGPAAAAACTAPLSTQALREHPASRLGGCPADAFRRAARSRAENPDGTAQKSGFILYTAIKVHLVYCVKNCTGLGHHWPATRFDSAPAAPAGAGRGHPAGRRAA